MVAQLEAERRPANLLGWSALIATVLFAFVLVIAMTSGAADSIYSTTMLVLQLVIAGVIVAAMITPRGRRFGAIALAVSLVCNVATVGALGAVTADARGAYDGVKSDEQRRAEAYPGVKDVPNGDVLAQRSLEEVQADGDALMAEIRERVTAEFGYGWVESGQVSLRNERNGYGGESMLQQYRSTQWTTTEPVRDNERKRAIGAIVDEVLAGRGMYALAPLNEPDSSISSDMIAKLYGSSDVEQQHTWEWYSGAYPDPLLLYVTVFDPSKDPTGGAQAAREAASARTGEPVAGVQLMIVASQLLSESDRDEFEQRIAEYPDF